MVLLGACVAPSNAPISIPEQVIPADFTTYTDEAGFFSISYPKDWQPIELSRIVNTKTIAQEIREGDLARATTVFMAGLADRNTPNLSINVNTAQGMGNNLYVEIQHTTERGRWLFSGYQLVSLVETTIGGKYAVVVDCMADYTGKGIVHWVHLYTIHNQTLWTVTCGCEPSEYENYKVETLIRELTKNVWGVTQFQGGSDTFSGKSLAG
jgi:hypothetical protein